MSVEDLLSSPKRLMKLVLGVVALIIVIWIPLEMVTMVDANEIVVKQSVTGQMTVWNDPGIHWQNFGRITRYHKTGHFEFDAPSEDDPVDKTLKLRFNDGGSARLSGSVTFDLPDNPKSMLSLHSKFRSMAGIVESLVNPTVRRAVYMSGPLVSSKESAGERRADLIQFVQDQASIGIYQTDTEVKEIPDLLAGTIEVPVPHEVPRKNPDGTAMVDENGKPVMETKMIIEKKAKMKKVQVVVPKKDAKGVYIVQEAAAVAEFSLRLYNWSVDGIAYDKRVEKQIEEQRQALMSVETAMAKSKLAEQNVIMVQKEGEATAAKAKWEQETEKARAVTKAQQEKEVAETQAQQKKNVAELDLQSAQLEAKAEIERGRGEAEAARAKMVADGALTQKLAAWVKVNQRYAEVLKGAKLVPDVVMGSSGQGSSSSVPALISMLEAKTAKELSLSVRPGR